MNETITVNEFGATIRKPYYIIEDEVKMKVTAEDLVRAIRDYELCDLAQNLGINAKAHPKETFREWQHRLARTIATLIDIPEPTPTIDGAINGQPATFEVVYRAED